MSARNLSLIVTSNAHNRTDEDTYYIPLFKDNDETLQVSQFELQTAMNEPGTLTITLPPNHRRYDYNFTLIGTVCFLYFGDFTYKTTNPFWGGRLYDMSIDLWGNKTLIFEGLLSRLSTVPCSTDFLQATSRSLYQAYNFVRDMYNNGAQTKGFTTVSTSFPDTARDSNHNVNFNDLDYSDNLLSILTNCVSQYNKYSDVGTNHITLSGSSFHRLCLSTVSSTNLETITTDMMTSYLHTNNAEPFANRIYAYGPSTDESVEIAGGKDGARVDMKLQIGKEYVEDITSISEVGVVAKTVIFENMKTISQLVNLANKSLKNSLKNKQSWSIGIVDTYALNGDYNHFKVGSGVKLETQGYLTGFTTYIRTRTYDFLNPLNDSITISKTKKKLTSQL